MIKLIGYGNPARGDDGLGPAFAARIAAPATPDLEVRSDYQLSVDHALWISDARLVVFIDALLDPGPSYRFGPVTPAANGGLASHTLSPESVLTLTRTLYGASPEAFLLGITGYSFGDIREELSKGARANLETATDFLRSWISERMAGSLTATSGTN